MSHHPAIISTQVICQLGDKVKGSKNSRVMCNSMPGVHTHAVGNCTDLTSLIFAFRKPVMKFMSTF